MCVHVSDVSEGLRLPFRQLCGHIGRASTGHLANPGALRGVVPATSHPHPTQNATGTGGHMVSHMSLLGDSVSERTG